MQTQEFRAGLKELMQMAKERVTVMMCSEGLPWRCHRSLVADALLVHGFEVVDIMSAKVARTHRFTSFAKLRGKRVSYPSEEVSQH